MTRKLYCFKDLFGMSELRYSEVSIAHVIYSCTCGVRGRVREETSYLVDINFSRHCQRLDDEIVRTYSGQKARCRLCVTLVDYLRFHLFFGGPRRHKGHRVFVV